VYDKVSIIQQFKQRTNRLQDEYMQRQQSEKKENTSQGSSINSETEYLDGAEEEDADINEINLTNQLIGEVQAFSFLMRWVIYEFYQFKRLKQEGQLQAGDFEALEDDLLFMIHKIIVKDEVYSILVILSRLLNNKEDKTYRNKFHHIGLSKHKLYPLDIETMTAHSARPEFSKMQDPDINPLLGAINDIYRRKGKVPFEK
jgi:hypothetical protein